MNEESHKNMHDHRPDPQGGPAGASVADAGGRDSVPTGVEPTTATTTQNTSTPATSPTQPTLTGESPSGHLPGTERAGVGANGPTGRPLPDFPQPAPLTSHGPARIIAMCNQ
ncbi:MAG: hypothetical protein ABIQ53_06535, partial [Terracoccus sp.]